LNYLFDTSALVAHALRLSGAELVQSIMDQEDAELFTSALSLFELAGVLKKNGLEKKTGGYWQIYTEGLEIVPADAELAKSAWRLREQIRKRLPIADAIIAASAQSVGATLVHGDQHLAQIPESHVPQIRILHRPEKTGSG
jgi:predicted nucleic acid-binding protein